MENKICWRVFVAFAFMVLSKQALADASTVIGIALFRADEPTTRAFLEGMGQGFDWANTALRVSGQRPLFCEPQSVVLTVEQRVEILERYYKRNRETGTKPLGLTLLKSLKEAFPCQ
jgi:hypothetical protein